jgi:hypothetical protein
MDDNIYDDIFFGVMSYKELREEPRRSVIRKAFLDKKEYVIEEEMEFLLECDIENAFLDYCKQRQGRVCKYFKKPIPIKAYDFSETKFDENDKPLYSSKDEEGYCITNDRWGSWENIREDDFIIEDVDGSRHPIRREIFFENYLHFVDNSASIIKI